MVEVTSLDKVYQELSAGLGCISFEYPSETVISMMVDSPIDCEQPLFFSVSHARERASSGEAARCEKRGRQPEKKRETARTARANEICVGLTTQKYDWLMREALTTNCQQSKLLTS